MCADPCQRNTSNKTCCVGAPYHTQTLWTHTNEVASIQTEGYAQKSQQMVTCTPLTHIHTHTHWVSSLRRELKAFLISTCPCLLIPTSTEALSPVILTTWNYNPNGMSGVSRVSKTTMWIYFLLWTCPCRDLPQEQEVTEWLAFLQPN